MSLSGPLAGAPARPGRYRRGMHGPQFSRYVTLRRQDRTLDDQRGISFTVSAAYALKASRTRPLKPSGAPPASASPASRSLPAQWRAWWITADGIKDPPQLADIPLESSADNPVIWRVKGTIGESAWGEPELYEARLPADVRERGGGEGDSTGTDVARTVAGFRFRATNMALLTDDLGSVPVDWSLIMGPEVWDIVEALASWEQGRYVDLRAVRRESAE